MTNTSAQKMSNSNDWPRISIVTPSYNQGRYIEETIESVLLQKYPNLEYVIVDGGSTDSSVDIIKRYANQLTWWVSESDDGQYAAINKGFSRTTGEIMLWLNSDDMLTPGSLWVLAEVFGRFYEVEWVSGIPFYWNKEASAIQVLPQLPFNRTLMRLGGYEGRGVHWVMQECTAWRRSLWERAGGSLATRWDYAGDFELWMRFAGYAQLHTIAAFLGGNRQHSEQKTINKSRYCEEVDNVLRMHPVSWVANRVMQISPIRKLLRAWTMIRRRQYHIWYNARTSQWAKQ